VTADAAARLHALTRHGSPVDRSQLVAFRPLDPANRPAPFKRYADRPIVALPTDFERSGEAAAAVLSGQARREPATLDARVLARLLFFTGGVTRVSEPRGGGDPTWFRAAMSAGNLHPVEVYVVCAELGNVPAGVHHFAPLEVGLTTLREGDHRDLLAAGTGAPEVTALPCSLVLTGVPFRTAWKYGERGYRHLFWDAGSMLGNLLALAEAFGLSARVYAGFVDRAVAELVGVDGVEELPLAVVTIGHSDAHAPAGGDGERLARLDLATAPVAPRPTRFPLIQEAHDDGNLTDVDAVTAWRTEAASLGLSAPDELEVPAHAGTEPLEDVILRRGSTRLMRPDPVRSELLTWGMGVAGRPVPGDFTAAGHTLVQHFLAVHAVEGVEPGAYRWRAGLLEQRRPGDHRALTAHLCLDQPLGGDAAFTAFHAADLDGVLATLGSRGYRATQLEAGIVAERLALAAFTLDEGATGLTFYDELVSQFFGTPTRCLLVTAVGVPAYRNRAGGSPGAPAELAHFDELMVRLASRLRGGF
jgi:SagB-type dehydrogenase family enzyme